MVAPRSGREQGGPRVQLHLAPAQHEGGERVDVRLDRGGAARDLKWEI